MIKCILLGSHLLFSGQTAVIVPHGYAPHEYHFESCESREPARAKIQKMSAWKWQCVPQDGAQDKKGLRV